MYSPQTGEFSQGSYLLGGKHFVYIINGDLKGISKRDTIRTFYENGNFDEYINYVTFKDCNGME